MGRKDWGEIVVLVGSGWFTILLIWLDYWMGEWAVFAVIR